MQKFCYYLPVLVNAVKIEIRFVSLVAIVTISEKRTSYLSRLLLNMKDEKRYDSS